MPQQAEVGGGDQAAEWGQRGENLQVLVAAVIEPLHSRGVGLLECLGGRRVQVVERIPLGEDVAEVVRGGYGGDLPVEDPGQLRAGQVQRAGDRGHAVSRKNGLCPCCSARPSAMAAEPPSEKPAARTPGSSW